MKTGMSLPKSFLYAFTVVSVVGFIGLKDLSMSALGNWDGQAKAGEEQSAGIDNKLMLRTNEGPTIFAVAIKHNAIYGSSFEGEGIEGLGRPGVLGKSNDGVGVEGRSYATGGAAKGVAGRADGQNSVGVYGESQGGFAGFFRGKVTITDSLLIDTINVRKITGAIKLFRIDHPLAPATKYLSHVSVESNEMTNLYSGNVILGPRGDAWIELPSWFEALNTNFRYQLTCVGEFASVYVAQEINGGHFRIAGGKPGLKVSWQVTGVRRDAYAKAHPLTVEQSKPPEERGRYLNPVELGVPASQGIGQAAH